MKYITRLSLLAAVLFLFMGFNPAEKPQAKVNWISIEEAVKLSEKDGKKILVDMYTDWCGWCKRMDATTYKNEEVVKYINEHYHAVKFDGEHKGEIVIKGRTFKFVPNGRRGYHELAASLMQGKMSYPTTVFLDENIQLLTAVPGYQQAPQLMPILAYFGENAYKDTDWNVFSQDYQSRAGK